VDSEGIAFGDYFKSSAKRMPQLSIEKFHRACELWKDFLWKNGSENFPQQGLWKSFKFPTAACGEKSVAALKQTGLIHIIFHYGNFYCLNLYTDIFILSFNKKGTGLCVLPVKKACWLPA
jgi:hypothetical protein